MSGPKGRLMDELRKAHFQFGSETQTNYTSMAKGDFKDTDVNTNRPQSLVDAPARKTNLQIGHNTVHHKDSMASSYGRYFNSNAGKGHDVSKLSDATKKDLRSHHFQLGYGHYGPDMEKSESASHFLPKAYNVGLKEEMEKTKTMSRTSAGFFDDQNKYFKSMYGETFNSQQKLDPKDVFTKDDIRNRLLTLRSSNIVMGNCGRNMSTTATEGFDNKHATSLSMNTYAGKPKASLTNLNINDGDGDFKSMAQADYVKKRAELGDKNEIKKTVQDLKSQHFTFGFDEPDYGTEAGSHFGEGKLAQRAKNPVDTKSLQKNSYSVGSHGFPANKVFSTIYNEAIGGMDQSKASKVPPFVSKAQKNRSDILFGTKDGAKDSEQRVEYTKANGMGQPGKLAGNINWGPTNIDHGGFETVYSSVYQSQFGSKGDASKIKANLNEDAMATLRRTNFHYGMRPEPAVTSHRADFQKREGGGAQSLTEENIKDLKGNHSVYGTDKENWVTSKQGFMGWKQPSKDMYQTNS